MYRLILILGLCLLSHQLFSAKLNCLSIADIHFNPYSSCQNKGCDLLQRLESSPILQWNQIFTAKELMKPSYLKDTNFILFDETLKKLKVIDKQQSVDKVFVLGDFLSHEFRHEYKKYHTGIFTQKGYENFVQKIILYILLNLHQAFPNASIYPIVGNNDSYQKDYYSDPNGIFFNDMSKIFSKYIRSDHEMLSLKEQLKKAGYYAFTFKDNSQIKLIALNSVLFSTKATSKKELLAAKEQLKWLEQELKNTKANHQLAMVIMHIPPSFDIYLTSRIHLFSIMHLWQNNYLKSFKTIINNYSPIILYIMTAHLHRDGFKYLQFKSDHEIPESLTTSISPIFGNDPGFKTFEIENEKIKKIYHYDWPLNDEKIIERKTTLN